MMRKIMKLLFLVAAGLALLASAAYACTVFKGKMTISQTGQTTRTNIGNNSGMGYCGGAASAVMTLDDASSYTVATAKSTGNCGAKLADDTYDLNKTSVSGPGDCMTGDGSEVNITTFQVTGGQGVGTVSPAGSTLDAGTAALCVTSWLNPFIGNQMSVSVV